MIRAITTAAFAMTAFAAAPSMAFDQADLDTLNTTGDCWTRCDLSNANLTGANLNGADLTDAKLFGANLWGATLTGAILCRTTMNDGSINNTNC